MAVDVGKLGEIAGWLANGAPSPRPGVMMQRLCDGLGAAGIPVSRVGLFVRTLHPDIYGRNFIWRKGSPVAAGTADFDIRDTPEYQRSPLRTVFEQGREVRQSLLDGGGAGIPFFDDMRAEGVTDYIALPLFDVDGSAHASSWATYDPAGFDDEQLTRLRALMPALARVIEILGLRRVASTLLDTYVGNRAGERILAGQIRRGHTETMHAAIWLSDLRGFTSLSDRLPAGAVVNVLNLYFDCQVAPILKNGGEVLKFMGDGLLAVFPIEDESDTGDVCARVLQAARHSRANVATLRHECAGEMLENFRFGLALHIGNVLYGNIGGGNRLDFTCIGPAVNLAARMEKIAAKSNRAIVASAAFARQLKADWADLGEFPVAGFSSAQRVYGLADETPDSVTPQAPS